MSPSSIFVACAVALFNASAIMAAPGMLWLSSSRSVAALAACHMALPRNPPLIEPASIDTNTIMGLA
ncbi:hypothetical protein IF2G_06433 [Cordyceps javanica]|nr:hypothetical protein IF2G_06433 [Cordyceps javanica]